MRCQVARLATMRAFGTENNSDPIASNLTEVACGRQGSPCRSNQTRDTFPWL